MHSPGHILSVPKRGALFLFLFAVVANLLVCGGRLASSDELAVYLTTESVVERGELAISPELVKNGIYGKDGKFYYGVGIAQPVLAIPFYVVGKLAANLLGLSDPMRSFMMKGAVSVLNQLFAGLIALAAFALGLRLGYSRRVSLFLTLALIFTTNLFPYFKSYMREPQLLLYLLAATYYLFRYKVEGRTSLLVTAGLFCGVGLLTRLTSVTTIPILFSYLLYVLPNREDNSTRIQRIVRGSMAFGAPIVVAIAINMVYNYVQFGSVIGTPYARAEFTTPLWVGLYGLLFSSGKSLFLYAPLAILGVASYSLFGREYKSEMFLFGALVLTNILFFAKFVSWAGDGSWGSRYLIPILPFLILPAGALIRFSKAAKRLALGLAVLGFLVQVGGVSIYLGNYHREIGEYPYTKDFSDPEFTYKSHFIPNYSPVVGHWRMLIRNTGIALSGEKPKLEIADAKSRIPLSEETQSNLLNTLDFWFMYAWYAGIRPALIFAGVLPLLLLTVLFGYKTLRLLKSGIDTTILSFSERKS